MANVTVNNLPDATIPLAGTDKVLLSRDGINITKTNLANLPISDATQNALSGKQNTLVAGNGIVLTGNVVSTSTIIQSVASVNSKTGDVVVNKSDVGLSNVDNTSDINKPVSTATTNALSTKANVTDLNNLASTVAGKQNSLVAGANIIISGNVISSTGTGGGGVVGVTTVNGRLGDVILAKSDVGLNNADNTSDATKPVSNLVQAALNLKADSATLTTGLAGKQNTLTAGSNITISGNTISAIGSAKEVLDFINFSSFPVTGSVETLYVDKLTNKIYRWNGTAYTTFAGNVITSASAPLNANLGDFWFDSTNIILFIRVNDSVNNIWLDISSLGPAAPVQSVSGKTGAVALVKADVGLGNVDNTSDLNKPVSTATTAAITTGLATKQNTLTAGTNITIVGSTINAAAAPVTTVAGKAGAVTLTSTDVGLGNVNNTSDALKPISTATQAALNLKADASALTTKQDTLVAGSNITITGNVIASTGGGAGGTKSVYDYINYSAFPVTGLIETLYVDKAANKLYRWTGSAYAPINKAITTSTTPPSNPAAGDLWFDSTNIILYVRVNDGVSDLWLDVSTAGANANGSVASVAGKTGVVTLNPNDVSLGNVDNTSDINKPVSTATQLALNAKQNTLTAGTNISIVGSTINSTSNLPVITAKLPIEVTTDIVPSTFTSFPSTPCNSLLITADSTVELEYARNGITANPIKIPRNSTKLVVGISNANEISVRRADYATIEQAVVTGYINGTRLYVTSVISGSIKQGISVAGTGVTGSPYVTSATFGVVSTTVVPGSGYTSASVSFHKPSGGVAAVGTVQISGGAVTGVTITDSGTGYTSSAVGTITGDGTGASATGIIRLGTGLIGTYTVTVSQSVNTLTTLSMSNPTTVQAIAYVGGELFGACTVVPASLDGAGDVTLASQVCSKVNIDNYTGYDLVYKYSNTVAKRLLNGDSIMLFGLTNANQIKLNKVDVGAPTVSINVEAFV